jgi:hypothetical protein
MILNMGISLLEKELNNVKNGQEYILKNKICKIKQKTST